jgi:phenylalanyl-tRNA synthetase alpha chain
MSGVNDDYDPKQVAALDPDSLKNAVTEAERAIAAAADLADLAGVKSAHLGDRSPVLTARREIGALPPAAKSDAGKRVNEARVAI